MKKYNSIDIFKLIMAIFVIAIHTHPYTSNNNIYNLIIGSAVPFFFLCSGFLLQKKVINSSNEIITIEKYMLKILKLYFVWSFIYLPITLYDLFFLHTDHSFLYRIFSVFIKYFTMGEQFYSWPLWYLLASFYSLCIVYFLKKRNISIKYILVLSIAFFIVGHIYTLLVSNIQCYSGLFYKILNLCSKLFGSTGRIIQSFFYICFGMIVGNIKEYSNKKVIYILLSIFFVINYFINNDIIKTPFYVLVFLTCLTINIKDNVIYRYLRKTSTIMYFTHMIFFFVFSLFVGFNNYGIVSFCFCLLSTLLLSLVLQLINKQGNNRVINFLFN